LFLQAIGDCVRALLTRIVPLHEANTIMEMAALNVAAMLFRCQLLQQRIKGLKIIVDAVNAVRVGDEGGEVHRFAAALCPLPPSYTNPSSLPFAVVFVLGQYRLATAAGLKPDDVKQWLTANGLFQALFDRRSTHNELLKRSGDVIRFAASTGMLSLEYVFCIASSLFGWLRVPLTSPGIADGALKRFCAILGIVHVFDAEWFRNNGRSAGYVVLPSVFAGVVPSSLQGAGHGVGREPGCRGGNSGHRVQGAL
jgi:hypothetical protein